MRFCDPHWKKLRAAFKERGLDKYVAKDGAQAALDLIEGKPDPLMAAHNAILSNVMDRVGLEVMMPNEDGTERCPLCYIQKLARESACTCGDPKCTPET